MSEEEMEIPMSPSSIAMILSNLFRREDGEPMDFYVRKIRLQGRPDKEELLLKLYKLKEDIDVSKRHFLNTLIWFVVYYYCIVSK